LCWCDYLRGYLSGFPFGASGLLVSLRASRVGGELRNTFALFHFLAFSLFFFFSLSFLLHYLRIKVGTFSVLLSGFFLLDLALFLNYATRGRAGGGKARGFGVLVIGLVSCILSLWVK
jgi:hypothetical protein